VHYESSSDEGYDEFEEETHAADQLEHLNGDAREAVTEIHADLMAESGIVSSKSAGRRAIEQGGAYLNNEKVTDVEAVPGESDLLHGRFLVLRHGKRTIGGIEITA